MEAPASHLHQPATHMLFILHPRLWRHQWRERHRLPHPAISTLKKDCPLNIEIELLPNTGFHPLDTKKSKPFLA